MEQDRVIVRAVASSAELDQARILFRAFVAWHRDRHAEDHDLIDSYFDDARFEQELAGLPGAYAPPSGRLLLAWAGGAAAGCAALRRIGDQSCEMKRMFVSPAARGRGVGRALGAELIRAARGQAYTSMYLDTSIRQAEALSLYRSLGFAEVEPYYDTPPPLHDWLVFLKLDLQPPNRANLARWTDQRRPSLTMPYHVRSSANARFPPAAGEAGTDAEDAGRTD